MMFLKSMIKSNRPHLAVRAIITNEAGKVLFPVSGFTANQQPAISKLFVGLFHFNYDS